MIKQLFSLAAIAALSTGLAIAGSDNVSRTDDGGVLTVTKSEGNKKYQVYGVAFYNLENLFDTINNNGKYDLEFSPEGSRRWDGKKYRAKLHNLAKCINAMKSPTTPLGPAVLGVSEIENITVLNDLVKEPEIRKDMLRVVHHDSPDRRGVDVGLLYNPRLFKLINVTNHFLDIGYPTRDQMVVVGEIAGDTLAVIVNHWPSRLGGQEQSSPNREAAARLSKQIADSLWQVNPRMGVIVMGDLNDDPADKSCAVELGAAKDAEGVGAHGFYNPWWRVLYDNGIGTLAYKGAWNLFDQIIVSGTLLEANAPQGGLVYRSCKVNNFDFLYDTEGARQGYPKRTFSGGAWLNGYSDHFPTEIFLVKER